MPTWATPTSAPSSPPPKLRLSRQVGPAPLELTVLAYRYPDPADRSWRTTLERDGDDDPLIVSENSVEGLTGDIVKRLHWTVSEAGDYTVTTCIVPRGACATARLAVSGTTP